MTLIRSLNHHFFLFLCLILESLVASFEILANNNHSVINMQLIKKMRISHSVHAGL